MGSARLRGEGTKPLKVTTAEIEALQQGVDYIPPQTDTVTVGILKCGCHGMQFANADELAAHLNTPKKARKSTLRKNSRNTGKIRLP